MRTLKRVLACLLSLAIVAGAGMAGAVDPSWWRGPSGEEIALVDMQIGEKLERGMYTVTREEYDVWHVEDCTAENPAGLQLDAEGNFVGYNNVSDMYVVLGSEKAMLVDLSNPHPDNWEDIQGIFDELAGYLEQIIWVTHWHGDHTGQFGAFSGSDAPIYITKEDVPSLSEEMQARVTAFDASKDTIDLGGRTFKCVLVPGHTDGSNMLYEVENKIGFSGDAVGSGSGIWLFGTFLQYEKGLKSLIDVIDNELGGEVKLYTGHAFQAVDFTTGEAVECNAQYVKDMLTLVENVKTAGEYEMAQYTASALLNTVVSYGTAKIDVARSQLAKWALKSGKGLGCFEDVTDPALDKNVTKLVAEGITTGTSYTTFEPDKTLDRAEFITMLGRTVGATVDQGADTGFADVVNDGWSQGYIAWGVENGLIQGYGDGTFGQYDTLTREQVNLIIGRFNEQFGAAIFGGITPFAEAEGDATRAEIANLLASALGTRDFMAQLLLPKTQAKNLDPDNYKAWGAFPEDDDYVQGIGGSSTSTDEVIALFDEYTYENKDENADELAKSIKYFVYDPVKHGADPNGTYPVQVWFHGSGNAVDNDFSISAVGNAGALLFAGEDYQQKMGTPVYIIAPLANESKVNGQTLGNWMTRTEDGSTSVYSKVLGDLISDFMEEHAANVGTLHINGTSAGGYMAWRYTMDYTDTVSSTFLMAPAFDLNAENVDECLEQVKDIPILHIHGIHDELVSYTRVVAPIEEKLNEAENYQLVPFEWVRNRDGAVFSLSVGMEMGQHCICNQVAEDLMFADGTPMNENIPNGVTGWYKTVFEAE